MNIIELAKQAGLCLANDEKPLIAAFAQLVIEAHTQELIGVGVEPFCEWPTFNHHAMGCGLEDRDIRDRYEAMEYGWDECEERMLEQGPFYTQDQLAAAVLRYKQDAQRYRWLRGQTTHDGIAIVMKNKHIDDSIGYPENINRFIDTAMGVSDAT